MEKKLKNLLVPGKIKHISNRRAGDGAGAKQKPETSSSFIADYIALVSVIEDLFDVK